MRPDSPRRSNKPDAEWIDNEKRRCHDRGMRLEVRRNEMQILKDDHFGDCIHYFTRQIKYIIQSSKRVFGSLVI